VSFNLQSWATASLAQIDAFLDRALPAVWPEAFLEPLRYPVFGGGKRVRPLLTLAAAEAIDPSAASLAAAIAGGSAVELVHTYSLVHDDLPAMDDDDERRGRPTVHRRWDDATAILVGDALLTEAFSVLAAAPLDAERRIQLVAMLARAAGAHGMVGGQAADIGLGGPVRDIDHLLRLHAGKTGALLQAAVEIGGVCAGANQAQAAALSAFGRDVGLAFQLADDVLDADQDAGDDGPPSYVKLLGVDETRRRAEALAAAAIAAVANLPAPAALIALAEYTVARDR
jgi:farnesyl diphosphate synthase